MILLYPLCDKKKPNALKVQWYLDDNKNVMSYITDLAVERHFSPVERETWKNMLDVRLLTSIMLGHFKDAVKLKDENRHIVNKYQKPIALFAKHLKMAAADGTTIVDVTGGTGTTAVREGCNPGE
eukprot:jgi/Tetstr1/422971/TSEL_013749.t1